AFEKALEFLARLSGIEVSEEDIEVSMNTTFVEPGMGAQDMSAIVAAWTSGAISQKTMLQNFKANEVLSPDTSVEDETKQIEEEKKAKAAEAAK
ncbi:hypothetical protein ACI3PL_20295, partial [Lacticaseibacillus paracasei]